MTQPAEQRLSEVTALVMERDRQAEIVRALDRRISELLGIARTEARKPRKQTLSASELRRACGIL